MAIEVSEDASMNGLFLQGPVESFGNTIGCALSKVHKFRG